MWHAQPNKDDVLYHSGTRGYGGSLHHAKPTSIITDTQGDASVDFNNFGGVVKSGTTSGSTAKVIGLQSKFLRNMTHTVEFSFGVDGGTPTDNPVRIGYMQNKGEARSVFLNLETEHFVYKNAASGAQNTIPTHSISSMNGTYLKIVWEPQNAHFLLQSQGQTSEGTIPAPPPTNADELLSTTYNTTPETTVGVTWFRHNFRWNE